MRFTKPEWVIHHDGTRSENEKRLSIFSVHVHPDGSRIATGGLDAKVRIWSTMPILSAAADASGKPPKALCTLSMHTGPVLTVRWAHAGRWLASGSDDAVVMIWDLDPAGAGRPAWGADPANVEGWKPLRRLPGHESDVTDLAWAPADRFLASTGLDSKVLIWCGYTLERLAKLDLHQGFVKGVCWDPVGEFLATQSDDRTVRIWRTVDWGLEATVDRPFEHSPGSTFFRRLSWSPDGAHITASNATNNNGFVFTAAVITRNAWTSDISLVGHENTVEVACYNPHIFLRDPRAPVATANICSVVALGADDRSISVWQTKSARPLVVAKDVFARQIMDLAWAVDGLALYAVSSDGTLAVFAFDPPELEGIAPADAQRIYLAKFGFVPPPLPAGFAHRAGGGGGAGRETPPLTPPPAQQNGFDHAPPAGPGERVTTLVARRAPKDRRRVQPTFLGSLGANGASTGDAPAPAPPSITINTISVPPPASASASSTGFGAGMDLDLGLDREHDFGPGADTDMAVPINALDTRGRRVGRGDVAVSYSGEENGGKPAPPPKARTLGGDRPRDRDAAGREVREIRWEGAGASASALGLQGLGLGLGPGNGNGQAAGLEAPSLKTFLEARVEETGDVLEARNSEDGSEPSEVSLFAAKEKSVQWLDYLPARALRVCASARFCAVALEDGALHVYSPTGRRIMPTLALGAPVAFLDAAKYFLMAITTTGQVFVWNTKTATAAHAPTSLLPLLTPTAPSPSNPLGSVSTVISASVRPNGVALVHLSNGAALGYDAPLQCWVRVGEAWWARGSTCWKGRQRASVSAGGAGGGVVAAIEARVAEHLAAPAAGDADAGAGGEEKDGARAPPAWWGAALTLGHLEARMHAARVLGSAPEYRQALLLYARALADEGFRGKAEEVLRELYGPVYWRPGRSDDGWSSTVLGLAKRDLAKEVLTIFARSKTLFKLAQDYQDLLRKASADE